GGANAPHPRPPRPSPPLGARLRARWLPIERLDLSPRRRARRSHVAAGDFVMIDLESAAFHTAAPLPAPEADGLAGGDVRTQLTRLGLRHEEVRIEAGGAGSDRD